MSNSKIYLPIVKFWKTMELKNLKPPETPEDLIEYLEKQRNDTSDLRHQINQHISKERVEEFREKRKFLQNIVITSATLLGFVSAFALLAGTEILTSYYLIAGLCFHLFLICFTPLYLRESMDNDIEGLLKAQDNYNDQLDYQINLAQRYIIEVIHDRENIPQKFKNYLDELLNSESAKKIQEDNKKLTEERKKRMSGISDLEFGSEMVIFSFASGTILIFLAIIGKELEPILLVSVFIILFYFAFTDSTKRIFPFFKFLKFITRKDLISYIKK